MCITPEMWPRRIFPLLVHLVVEIAEDGLMCLDWQVDSILEFAQSDMMRNQDAIYGQKQPREGY